MSTATTPRKIFVNLAARDIPKTRAFWTKLGFGFNDQFCDDKTLCMVISPEAFVMLLTPERLKDFARKPLADSTKQTEGLFCLSADSRAEVDELVKTAVESGGTPAADKQDLGFMYSWSFYDPDGHHWEVMYMDPASIEKA